LTIEEISGKPVFCISIDPLRIVRFPDRKFLVILDTRRVFERWEVTNFRVGGDYKVLFNEYIDMHLREDIIARRGRYGISGVYQAQWKAMFEEKSRSGWTELRSIVAGTYLDLSRKSVSDHKKEQIVQLVHKSVVEQAERMGEPVIRIARVNPSEFAYLTSEAIVTVDVGGLNGRTSRQVNFRVSINIEVAPFVSVAQPIW